MQYNSEEGLAVQLYFPFPSIEQQEKKNSLSFECEEFLSCMYERTVR